MTLSTNARHRDRRRASYEPDQAAVLEPDANCTNSSTREAGRVERRAEERKGEGVVSIGYGIRTLSSGGLEVVSRGEVAGGATI
jgi:hypothetical protein